MFSNEQVNDEQNVSGRARDYTEEKKADEWEVCDCTRWKWERIHGERREFMGENILATVQRPTLEDLNPRAARAKVKVKIIMQR